MKDHCPYLGTRWDSSLPYVVPDSGNRCFAKHRQVRVYLFFHKEVAGVRIPDEQQKEYCYGDYGKCPDYKRQSSKPPNPEVGKTIETPY